MYQAATNTPYAREQARQRREVASRNHGTDVELLSRAGRVSASLRRKRHKKETQSTSGGSIDYRNSFKWEGEPGGARESTTYLDRLFNGRRKSPMVDRIRTREDDPSIQEKVPVFRGQWQEFEPQPMRSKRQQLNDVARKALRAKQIYNLRSSASTDSVSVCSRNDETRHTNNPDSQYMRLRSHPSHPLSSVPALYRCPMALPVDVYSTNMSATDETEQAEDEYSDDGSHRNMSADYRDKIANSDHYRRSVQEAIMWVRLTFRLQSEIKGSGKEIHFRIRKKAPFKVAMEALAARLGFGCVQDLAFLKPRPTDAINKDNIISFNETAHGLGLKKRSIIDVMTYTKLYGQEDEQSAGQ